MHSGQCGGEFTQFVRDLNALNGLVQGDALLFFAAHVWPLNS